MSSQKKNDRLINFDVYVDRFNARSQSMLEYHILGLDSSEDEKSNALELLFIDKTIMNKYTVRSERFFVKTLQADNKVNANFARVHIVNDEKGYFKQIYAKLSPETLKIILKMGLIPSDADALQCLSVKLIAALGSYHYGTLQRYDHHHISPHHLLNVWSTHIAQESIVASQVLERCVNNYNYHLTADENLTHIKKLLDSYQQSTEDLYYQIPEDIEGWDNKKYGPFKDWYQLRFKEKEALIEAYKIYLAKEIAAQKSENEKKLFLEKFLKPYGPNPYNPRCLGYFLEKQYAIDLAIQARAINRIAPGYARRGKKRKANILAKRILKNDSYNRVYRDPITQQHQLNFADDTHEKICLMNLNKYGINLKSEADIKQFADYLKIAEQARINEIKQPTSGKLIYGAVDISDKNEYMEPRYGFSWGVNYLFIGKTFFKADSIVKIILKGVIWLIGSVLIQTLGSLIDGPCMLGKIAVKVLWHKQETTIDELIKVSIFGKLALRFSQWFYPKTSLGYTKFTPMLMSLRGILIVSELIKKNIVDAAYELVVKPFKRGGRLWDWISRYQYDFRIKSKITDDDIAKILQKYPAMHSFASDSKPEQAQVEQGPLVLEEKIARVANSDKLLDSIDQHNKLYRELISQHNSGKDPIKTHAQLPFNRTKDASPNLISLAGDGAHSLIEFFDNTLRENPQSSGKPLVLMGIPIAIGAAGLIVISGLHINVPLPSFIKALSQFSVHLFIGNHFGYTQGFTAGIIWWKNLYLLFELIQNGPKSLAASLGKVIGNHPLTAGTLLVAATYLGIAIKDAAIPFLSDELKVAHEYALFPYFEEFFAGLKLSVIPIEAFAAHTQVKTTVVRGRLILKLRRYLDTYVELLEEDEAFKGTWDVLSQEQKNTYKEKTLEWITDQPNLNDNALNNHAHNPIINRIKTNESKIKHQAMLHRVSHMLKAYRANNGLTALPYQDRETIRRWAYRSSYQDKTVRQTFIKSMQANLFPSIRTIDANNSEPKRPIAVSLIGFLPLPIKLISFIIYDCLIWGLLSGLLLRLYDYDTVKSVITRDFVDLVEHVIDLLSLMLVMIRKAAGALLSISGSILKVTLITIGEVLAGISALASFPFIVVAAAMYACLASKDSTYKETFITTFKLAMHFVTCWPFIMMHDYENLTQAFQGVKRGFSWFVDKPRDFLAHVNIDSAIHQAETNELKKFSEQGTLGSVKADESTNADSDIIVGPRTSMARA